MAKRFVRIRSGKVIAGVCTGLAEYFNIDVTLVRVVFLLLALAYGTAVLAYVILWIAAPLQASTGEPPA